jgi:hypothetical protein
VSTLLEELQNSMKVTIETEQAGSQLSPLNLGERLGEMTFRGGLD